mgnify:CR=1 FL=1
MSVHLQCPNVFVDIFDIEAFLPGKQIDVKPIRDYDQFVGKNMEFKVVKINKEFKNVVVSHKALIEAEIEEQKKQMLEIGCTIGQGFLMHKPEFIETLKNQNGKDIKK